MGKFYKDIDVVEKKRFRIPAWVNIDFSDIPGKEFVIQEGDRLDILSEQLWGNPSFWKYLAAYNGIGYIFDINPGDIIKIPFDIQQVIRRV